MYVCMYVRMMMMMMMIKMRVMMMVMIIMAADLRVTGHLSVAADWHRAGSSVLALQL